VIMSAGVRRAALTTHVATSVGWLGAVAAFLALAVVGKTSQDAGVVRAAYLAMEVITWLVIVPLCLASLVTGLLQALFTRWGIFQYYWITTKLALTAIGTVILLLKTRPIGVIAIAAAQRALSGADLRALRNELIVHAAGGMVLLLVILTVSIYKPWGRTQYGVRKFQKQRSLHSSVGIR